jgi:hypothetical protein
MARIRLISTFGGRSGLAEEWFLEIPSHAPLRD